MTTTTTIPGELFLLLTNDAGRQDSTSYRKQALAAAAIAELVLHERVAVEEKRNPRVQVVDPAPTGEPVLDQVLEGLGQLRDPRLSSALSRRCLDMTESIGQEFAAAGAVDRKSGWFTTTWPTVDPALEQQLRARLAASVREPSRASLQDGILLEMLRALRNAHRILRDDLEGMSRRELDEVIKNLDIDHPAAAALKRTMDDMTAAMMVTTAAAGGAVS